MEEENAELGHSLFGIHFRVEENLYAEAMSACD
jgi:hypothetical protein